MFDIGILMLLVLIMIVIPTQRHDLGPKFSNCIFRSPEFATGAIIWIIRDSSDPFSSPFYFLGMQVR